MDPVRTDGYLCQVSPAVEELAGTICTGDAPDQDARELFRWVRDTFCWDMTAVRGAGHLVDQRPEYAMSFDKSNLLVALLRSQGIPARFRLLRCTFHNRYRDREDASIHAPVEIRLDGDWVTADPAFGPQTSRFIPASTFGEPTWEQVRSSERMTQLPRWLVWGYNYCFRFVHPDIRRIRAELRDCQPR